MSATFNLDMLAEHLTEARDKAYQDATEALQRIRDLREERINGLSKESVFDRDTRERRADLEREVALAGWAANALALSSLYLSTDGAYGIRYEDSPSPYRRRRENAASETAGVR